MQSETIKNAILGITVSSLIVCLLTISIVFSSWDKSYIPLSTINRNETSLDQPSHNFTGISVIANFSLIDRTQYKFTMRFSYQPFGTIIAKDLDFLAANVAIIVDSTVTKFSKAEMMQGQELSFPIQEGSPIAYPFDQYYSSFKMKAMMYTDDGNSSNLPLSVSIGSALSEWRLQIKMKQLEPDYSSIYTAIQISRAPTQQFFSLFIGVIMWVMSIGVFSFSISHLWYNRKVESPTLVILLIGSGNEHVVCFTCSEEHPTWLTTNWMHHGRYKVLIVVGFFWNMGLITVASIILLYRFSLQAAKPYIPLQRGRTGFSLFQSPSHYPLQQQQNASHYPLQQNASHYPLQQNASHYPLQHNLSNNMLNNQGNNGAPRNFGQFLSPRSRNISMNPRMLEVPKESLKDHQKQNYGTIAVPSFEMDIIKSEPMGETPPANNNAKLSLVSETITETGKPLEINPLEPPIIERAELIKEGRNPLEKMKSNLSIPVALHSAKDALKELGSSFVSALSRPSQTELYDHELPLMLDQGDAESSSSSERGYE